MTILIVDDEKLLREKIRGVLESSSLSIDKLYLAENAIEAIRIIDEKSPDIILSDIRMPLKSGLDLAAYVNEKRPHTPVILITGYSDFEYAQTAIQNRVFDYILKPVEPDKLIASVQRAQKNLELEEKHQRLYTVFQEYFASNLETVRRQFIEGLLFRQGPYLDADQQRETFQLDFTTYRLVAVGCSTAIESGRMEGQYYCTYLTEKYIQELLPETVTYVFGNRVFFLWRVTEEDPFTDSEAVLALLKRVLAYARENFLGMLSAGISQVSHTLANIQNLRQQTSECLDLLEESGRNDFLFYEDIAENAGERWETENSIHTLVAAIRSGNRAAVLRQFEQVVIGLQKDAPGYAASSYLVIISNVSFLMHEMNVPAGRVTELTNQILPLLREEDMESSTRAISHWLGEVCQEVANQQQSRCNVVVNAVREFINAHYSEPVGLAEASRAVGRNPSYVSRLIKEHTGKSFTQLLTDKRIQEAKRLLKETSLKVGDVAQRVGYVNVRYFNRVFKAAVNMSAHDYRSFTSAFD